MTEHVLRAKDDSLESVASLPGADTRTIVFIARRFAALTLAYGISVSFVHIRSEDNPADAPSLVPVQRLLPCASTCSCA